MIFILMLVTGGLQISYAQLLLTQTGETSFNSDTPIEKISATNKQTGAALNPANGAVAVKIIIRNFHFPNKLMEEHFNENYMESEKYPNATFNGKIQETIDYTKDGVYDVSAKGTLEIHGVKQERILKGKLTISKGQMILDSNFDVKLVDHKISVPTIVIAKIAEVISVKNHFVLAAKK
jgi:polyisoprenoid-binding protein YceI